MASKGVLGFPTQFPNRRVEKYADLQVKCPLLSDYDQNWNVSTDTSNTSKCQIS